MSHAETNKKIIIVLGMHRSGTSAIARGLQVMGVELGDRLMPPNQEVNAKGFWEDIDLNALNIEMLHALESEWNYLTPLDSANVETLHNKGYFLRAVELIQQKIGNAPVFGLKDPRTAKLLPFWKEVFNYCRFDMCYVLALRHPLSVVRSLEKRDSLDRVASYVLWLEHVLFSLEHTVGCKRVIVDYDLLMQSAERELERIANRFDLPIDPISLQSYEVEFLEDTLRHSVHDLNDLLLDSACPPLVREVYKTLLCVASGVVEDDASLQSNVELWMHEFERITPLLNLVDKLVKQNKTLDQNLAESEYLIAEFEQVLSECENYLDTGDKTIAEGEERPTGIARYLAECEKLTPGFGRAVSACISQLLSDCKNRVGCKNRIANLNVRLAECDKQIAEQADELIRRGEWALGMEQRLKEARAQIAYITSSNSWRITRPLRVFRRLLSSPLTQARYCSRWIFNFIRAIYVRLPLSIQSRTVIRRFISKYASWVLRAGSHSALERTLQRPQRFTLPTTNLRAAAEGIRLMTSSQPLVTIIIPIYGQIEYTLTCLISIAANQPSFPYEIIVIDDCSPDDSLEVLQKVSGIHLIQNPMNQGFIRSCNLGADAAKGEYVYFLNNDTQVTADWLDELVRTFTEFPGTGLAGSKLVYPDGALQEAGGIIWQDGSAWNFGRNQDPSLPVYNYAREVDYCSGASIMAPKKLFDELGGFDEHYLPAYCEDTDIALKIRDLGYRVIYQPLSVVVHFEGVTSGTDTARGAKAYQIENLKKQFSRWSRRLAQHQAPGTKVDQAKDRTVKYRVLVIDHCTPTPCMDAGSVLVFNLLLLFREMNFQVTFIPEDNFLYMPKHTPALQRVGIEMLYAPYCKSVDQHLREFGGRYDLVLLIRPNVVERHIQSVRKYCSRAKVLFHTIDIHYLRMSREADIQKDRAKKSHAVDEMKQREFAAIRAVDATIVVSTKEIELLRPELPAEKIYVFPLIMDILGTNKGFKERRGIIFVGGYQHKPNVDAVKYFVLEIMPIIRLRLPGVNFYIVGSNPPPEILALAAMDISVVGFVEDINPMLDQMRVSVAPLRFGAGVKGKIASAMAVGLPVVATPIAAEGMSITNGENVLVADSAEDFAEAVIQLYEDEALWHAISKSSIKFADSAWGTEAAWNNLAAILVDMGFEAHRGNRPLSLYSAKRSIDVHTE